MIKEYKEGKVYISKDNYKKLPNDYKGFVDGVPYALAFDPNSGTVYAPAIFVEVDSND